MSNVRDIRSRSVRAEEWQKIETAEAVFIATNTALCEQMKIDLHCILNGLAWFIVRWAARQQQYEKAFEEFIELLRFTKKQHDEETKK